MAGKDLAPFLAPIMVDPAGFKPGKFKSDFAAVPVPVPVPVGHIVTGPDSVPVPLQPVNMSNIANVANSALAGALAGVLTSMALQPVVAEEPLDMVGDDHSVLTRAVKRINSLEATIALLRQQLGSLQSVVVLLCQQAPSDGAVPAPLPATPEPTRRTARWNNLHSCFDSVNSMLQHTGDRSSAFKEAFGQNCTANLNVALDQLIYMREYGDIVPHDGRSLVAIAAEKAGQPEQDNLEGLLYQVNLADIIKHARALGSDKIGEGSKTFLETFMAFRYPGKTQPEIREQRKAWRDALDNDRKKQPRFPLNKNNVHRFAWAI
jgi:hypothetical protein